MDNLEGNRDERGSILQNMACPLARQLKSIQKRKKIREWKRRERREKEMEKKM